MSKQVTITLPDELRDKVKRYKDRVNISSICQKALDQKISDFERQEAAVKNDPDIEAVIERLKKEKEMEENEWLEKGRKAGLVWAKQASYRELRCVATKLKSSREKIRGESEPELSDEETDLMYLDFMNLTVWPFDSAIAPPAYCLAKGKPDKSIPYNNFCVEPEEPGTYYYPGDDFLTWEDGIFESVRRFWEEIKGRL